jgi:hypothetical protein
MRVNKNPFLADKALDPQKADTMRLNKKFPPLLQFPICFVRIFRQGLDRQLYFAAECAVSSAAVNVAPQCGRHPFPNVMNCIIDALVQDVPLETGFFFLQGKPLKKRPWT